MPHQIVLEYDPEIDRYSAVCTDLQGCASAGDTEAEARLNLEEAIRLYLDSSEMAFPPAR